MTLVAVVGGFDAWLVLPFIAWLLLYAAALGWFVPRLARSAQRQADARSLMTGRITDAYTNIATVKLFSHAGREAAYARAAMHDFLATVHVQMRLISGFEIVNHLLAIALIAGTGGITLWLWSRGQVGVGAVAAATAMALRLNGISHWVMWELAGLFEHVGTVQDGMRTLSRPRRVLDRPGAAALQVPRGEVHFDDAGFRYGAGPPVIERLQLQLRAGEKIGLVGRSGAGKSTLVGLLLRFHELEAGRILIDGQDIAGVTQDSLRAHIGMVTQDSSLLHRSVRDNILYGRPDASEADMIEAARRAEAHEFILRKPGGYDFVIGERGQALSGGERQRLAIARALLKDAPILLLDEATSALDTETEARIKRALDSARAGRTTFVIAHRLSTIVDADLIVVLDAGRIVEQGRFDELARGTGPFARLVAEGSFTIPA